MVRKDRTLLLALLAATALSGPAYAADPDGTTIVKTDSERLRPGLYPAAPVPEEFAVPPEPGHPLFAIDWSVGLKGTYSFTSTENSFVTTVNPQFTATHDGQRADLVFDGEAEISRPWDATGAIDISTLRLGATVTAPIDSLTTASATAALALNQDSRSSLDLDPLIVVPPQVLSGSVGAGLDRTFGRFNLTVAGSAQRTLYGATDRTDTGVTDNSANNLWAFDSSVRLGFEATPIIGVFGEASAGRNIFDSAGTSGVRNDATDLALRGGVTGSWNGILSASASIGRGYHNFDAASLGDVATELYDASLTFTPNSTISLTATLDTRIEPAGADSNGTARIARTAAADLSYTVNSWLRLRASADWSQSVLTGSTETERRYGFGAGADYKLNRHTAISADYGFSHRDNSTTGTLDAHTVSLGVTLRR